jgi:hypothetical protein
MSLFDAIAAVSGLITIWTWLRRTDFFYAMRRFAEYPRLGEDASATDAVVFVGYLQTEAAFSAGVALLMVVFVSIVLHGPTSYFPIPFTRQCIALECSLAGLLFAASLVGSVNVLQGEYLKRFPRRMLDEQLRARNIVPPSELRRRRDALTDQVRSSNDSNGSVGP